MTEEKITTFEELALSPEILKAVKRMGFSNPTPGAGADDPGNDGRQRCHCQGTDRHGKNLCFRHSADRMLISRLQGYSGGGRLSHAGTLHTDRRRAASACGVPAGCAHRFGLRRTADCQTAGGAEKQPHIVVATPGRLLDHMGRGTVWLGNVYTAVLDEADEMLKMGFIRDVRKILNSTPADTQVVMFSATISREVMDVAWEYQHDAVEITVAAEGDNRPDDRSQFSLLSSGERRLEDMGRIIDDMGFKRVMVFCNMKNTVRRVHDRLRKQGTHRWTACMAISRRDSAIR